MDVADAVAQLAAKQEIREVVLRYCRGIDRLDMALVRSCYHEDGIDHHTGFSGRIGGYIAWVQNGLSRFDGTTHIVGNHLSEIDGDTAIAETYGMAVHWGTPAEDARLNFTTGFRYVDHMRRRKGRWAIKERWALREWTYSDVGRAQPKEGQGPSGSRDPDDPMWALRRRLGFESAR